MWTNPDGEYTRPVTEFREWVKKDDYTGYLPERGRYHLYVSWACPWASRVTLVRKLRKLEDVISMSVVDPIWNENGWKFSEGEGCVPDFVNHQPDLISVYRLGDPYFVGDETVPVLWDKKTNTVVNNESREIMRMLDVAFADFGDPSVNLYYPELGALIDETIDQLYPTINNGVYRAGFAQTQQAYEEAVRALFEGLDHWDRVLERRRFLCGENLTEADVCLFATLVRFDAVYYSHFKCNLKRIRDYRNLYPYLKDIYQIPGVSETVNFDHIKRHYYGSQLWINPSGIVPLGPPTDLTGPSYREKLGGRDWLQRLVG